MTVDTTRFCGVCGAARESTALRFCRQCGTPFAPTGSVPVVPLLPPLHDARRRPPGLVWLLGLFGSATYAFFWLWMSWRELKRIRGEASMHPFWHSVAAFFPIYGLFRFHAHFRTLDELLEAARLPVRAGAGLLTLVFLLLIAVLYGSLALSSAGVATGKPMNLSPFSLLAVGAAYSYVVTTGQAALNAYYASLTGVAVPERGHAFEYIFIVLFALAFLAQLYLAVGGSASFG